jgi:ferredoxin
MLKSVAIVYFSGTGNTEAITGFLVQELSRHFRVDVFKVEELIKGKKDINFAKYQLIGFGYPIYGFNAPGIMVDFAEQLPDTLTNKAFVYSTCAGPIYLNDIASYRLKRVLNSKGLQVFYERQFYMPANIATRYNDEVAKQLCNAAARKSAIMAEEIRLQKSRVRNDRIGPLLLAWLYLAEKNAWKSIPRDFLVLETCIKCQKCVEGCPTGNISFQDDKIRFENNCLACYRCVYLCPTKSITGRKYKFAIFKDGYDINKIIANDELKGDFITPKTYGYYRIFRKYLFEE